MKTQRYFKIYFRVAFAHLCIERFPTENVSIKTSIYNFPAFGDVQFPSAQS